MRLLGVLVAGILFLCCTSLRVDAQCYYFPQIRCGDHLGSEDTSCAIHECENNVCSPTDGEYDILEDNLITGHADAIGVPGYTSFGFGGTTDCVVRRACSGCGLPGPFGYQYCLSPIGNTGWTPTLTFTNVIPAGSPCFNGGA